MQNQLSSTDCNNTAGASKLTSEHTDSLHITWKVTTSKSQLKLQLHRHPLAKFTSHMLTKNTVREVMPPVRKNLNLQSAIKIQGMPPYFLKNSIF